MPPYHHFEAMRAGCDPDAPDYHGEPFVELERARGTLVIAPMPGCVLLDHDPSDTVRSRAVAAAPVSGGLAVAAVYHGEEPTDVSVLVANHPLTLGYDGAEGLSRAAAGQDISGRLLRQAVLLVPVQDWSEDDPGSSGKLSPDAEAVIDDYRMVLSRPDGVEPSVVGYMPQSAVTLGEPVPHSERPDLFGGNARNTLLADLTAIDGGVAVALYTHGQLHAGWLERG